MEFCCPSKISDAISVEKHPWKISNFQTDIFRRKFQTDILRRKIHKDPFRLKFRRKIPMTYYRRIFRHKFPRIISHDMSVENLPESFPTDMVVANFSWTISDGFFCRKFPSENVFFVKFIICSFLSLII